MSRFAQLRAIKHTASETQTAASSPRRLLTSFFFRQKESKLKVASIHLDATHFAWSELGRSVGTTKTINGKEMDAADVWEGRMFVGSAHAAQDVESLKRHNIRWILTVAESLCEPEPNVENEHVYDHAVLEIPDLPTSNMLEHLDDCLDWIDHALEDPRGGGVLVHCAQGISRSVTIAVAFLMRREKLSLDDAMARVKQNRACASPNFGFYAQLSILQDCGLDTTEAKRRLQKGAF